MILHHKSDAIVADKPIFQWINGNTLSSNINFSSTSKAFALLTIKIKGKIYIAVKPVWL